jgi:hypothetical protein
MSLDLILVVVAIAIGIAYFAVRNNRKQREIGAQARRAAK